MKRIDSCKKTDLLVGLLFGGEIGRASCRERVY